MSLANFPGIIKFIYSSFAQPMENFYTVFYAFQSASRVFE